MRGTKKIEAVLLRGNQKQGNYTLQGLPQKSYARRKKKEEKSPLGGQAQAKVDEEGIQRPPGGNKGVV